MTASCANLRYSYLFDPPVGEKLTDEDRARYELAAILCASCPVLEACATDKTAAKSAGFRHGVLFTFGRNGKPHPRSLAGPKRKYPNFRVAVTLTEKPCPRCHVVKPIADFRIDRARADGHGTYCRPCKDTMTREQQRRAA